MAITAKGNSKTLKVKVQTGVNSKGEVVLSTRTLGIVKASAVNEDLYAIGSMAAALQSHTVDAIQVSESYELLSK